MQPFGAIWIHLEPFGCRSHEGAAAGIALPKHVGMELLGLGSYGLRRPTGAYQHVQGTLRGEVTCRMAFFYFKYLLNTYRYIMNI